MFEDIVRTISTIELNPADVEAIQDSLNVLGDAYEAKMRARAMTEEVLAKACSL